MEPSLLTAFGLFLLIEGLMPFAMPGQWREVVRRIASLTDGQIRFMGLGAIAAGLALLLVF